MTCTCTCTCGTVRLIGDVHGDASALERLRGAHRNAIQIGDMGLGFRPQNDHRLDRVIVSGNRMRFFRGNHDDPAQCKAHPKHLASGWHPEGFFVVGGGLSIDKQHRTPGLNWWSDEEHNATELKALVAQFETRQPNLVLTHEAPPVATDAIFSPAWKFESATARALQAMWDVWQPDLWIFGHWHRTRQIRIGRTLFMCVGEKEAHDVHLPSCPAWRDSVTSTREHIGAKLERFR